MALQNAYLPKWIMAKDTGEEKRISIPVGLGSRVFIKAENSKTTQVAIIALDSGQDGGGITGGKKDAAIELTVAAAANQRPLIEELTNFIARAGSTDPLNTNNTRILFLDGDNLGSIPLATAISDVKVIEDINA